MVKKLPYALLALLFGCGPDANDERGTVYAYRLDEVNTCFHEDDRRVAFRVVSYNRGSLGRLECFKHKVDPYYITTSDSTTIIEAKKHPDYRECYDKEQLAWGRAVDTVYYCNR